MENNRLQVLLGHFLPNNKSILGVQNFTSSSSFPTSLPQASRFSGASMGSETESQSSDSTYASSRNESTRISNGNTSLNKFKEKIESKAMNPETSNSLSTMRFIADRKVNLRSKESTIRNQVDSIQTSNVIHIQTSSSSSASDDDSESESEIASKETFNVARMSKWLRGTIPSEFVESYLELLQDPLMLKDHSNLTKEQSRDLLTRQLKFLLDSGLFKITDQKQDPVRMLTAWSMFGWQNFALQVKMVVHLYLYGGAVYNLGTKRHMKMIEDIESFRRPGAFCMTELEHGSNVRMLQTTAIYDKRSDEFIINTPNEGAVKWWIGNLQKDAVNSAVFARLIHEGKDHGIHAFIVPIRDPKTMKAYEGVYIGDCGDKVGLNSIDNGFVAFTNVRIPRRNLLNKYGHVKKDGTYQNPYGERRFTAMLGELISGRMAIIISTIMYRRIATTIAVRYALQRKQFGGTEESAIMNYPTHQVRIMPILASCYIYEFTKRLVMDKYRLVHGEEYTSTESTLASLHGYVSGLKAVLTWDTQKYFQTLRECCGGQGYSAYNRFGEMKNDNDVKATFEGDNTVLVQQFAGFLMKKYGKVALSRMTKIKSQMHDIRQEFRNEGFQVLILEYRMLQLIEIIVTYMTKSTKTLGYFNAWQNMGPNIVKLARAGVEYVSFKKFIKNSCTEPSINLQVLKIIQDVFVVDCIVRDPIGFIEIVDKSLLVSIESTLAEYCKKLSFYANDLVNAFNIPDHVIRAPIGRKDRDYVRETLNDSILRNIDNHSFNIIDYPLFSYTEEDLAKARKRYGMND